jgi:hypothetical protein
MLDCFSPADFRILFSQTKPAGGEFFLFLHFFHLSFAKIYGQQKKLQNYTSGVVGDGGRRRGRGPVSLFEFGLR